MVKLPNDIHVVERGWLSANQVFHKGNGRLDIVDSGFYSHIPQTISLVKHQLSTDNNLKPEKLINTHLHSDHCGGNTALANEFGFEIYIPSSQLDSVRNWDEDKLSYKELGQHCPSFKPDHPLEPNETIALGSREWKILGAPGHDPHSIMLFDKDSGILISADALWEKGFGALFPELAGEGGFEEARACLDLIKEIQPSIVIPGHGKPFTEVNPALDYAYSRLDYLESDIERNALHVAKVLFKFKMLELQTTQRDQLFDWMKQTPMLSKVQLTLQLSESELFDKTINALIKAQALKAEGGLLIDFD